MHRLSPLVLLLAATLVAAPPDPGTDPSPPTSPPTSPAWLWPVDVPRLLVRPFLPPESEYGAGHRGIDIAAGRELLAPADGVVHFSGAVVDRPVLSLDHGGGVLSSFEAVSSELRKGDRVRRGEEIGVIEPGHCSIDCVHVGVRVNGAYVSPLLYFGGLERSVLLPTRYIDVP